MNRISSVQRKVRKDSRQQEVVCPSCQKVFRVSASRLRVSPTPCCSQECATAYRAKNSKRSAGRQPRLPEFIKPPLIRSFIAEGKRAGLNVAAMAGLISANCATSFTTTSWLSSKAKKESVGRMNPHVRQYMTMIVIQGMSNRGEIGNADPRLIAELISTESDGRPGGPPVLRNYSEMLRTRQIAPNVWIEQLDAATGVRHHPAWLKDRLKQDDIHELPPGVYRHIALAVLEFHGPKRGLPLSNNEMLAIVESTA